MSQGKVIKFLGCIIFLCNYQYTYCVLQVQPQQIHLSYGVTPDQMVITWVTMNATKISFVEYGENNLDSLTKGMEEKFVDGGTEKRTIYFHRVTLTNLTPGQHYVYHVGSPLGWSEVFYFTAKKSGQSWSPRFALFGDMGNTNAQSIGRLQEETQRGHFDAILHVGDFAYNMDTDNARVGDEFMTQIQSIAAYVPYMTVAGNHESAYNFSNYRYRFSMPGGDGRGMFYSFDVGPVHFIGFNSEYYYYLNYGQHQIANQYKWLEEDLKNANKAENRAARPWIISMCHRPMYCSNSNDPQHCPNKENIIRVGYPVGKYNIESLLYKYGVDIHFQAHEHSYERMWPVYNMTVCNGSSSNPYHNARAPVHIVTGSAGCDEQVDPFVQKPNAWSAFHSDDYGYTRMTVQNKTHVYMEQVSDDQGGKVIDSIWISKDRSTSQNFDCHLKNSLQTDDALKFKPAKFMDSNARISLL